MFDRNINLKTDDMRKTIQILSTVALAVFLLSSCGNSVERDAKKVAELQCKAEKLAAKAVKSISQAGSSDLATIQAESQKLTAESQKLASEAVSLYEKLKEKYSTEADKQKFSSAYLKALGDCK